MNNQYITVNLIPNLSAPAVACVSQYDVGRTLVFRVYNGVTSADLTDTTAVAVGTKKSGLGFSVTGTISGNTVTFNSTLEMTQESGMIPAEIRFSKTGENIGTANFTLAVEPSPHLDGTTDGTQETMANLQTQLNGLDTRVTALEAGGGGSGLSSTEKQLILTLFSKAAYAESDAGTAYDALEELWTTTIRTITYNLSHVSSSNSTASIENGQSYTTTLTASTNYTLNSVSVTMGGVDITSTAYSSGTVSIPSVTGNIVITATAVLQAQSITATYTQSGTVYDTDSLDSLKTDLVVTANYSGGTSETVPSTDYTLSGTLVAGTSTITVSYGGKTASFNVTVSSMPYVTDGLIAYWDGIDNTGNGHDASATKWTDIVGGYELTMRETTHTTWDTNAISFDGNTAQGLYCDSFWTRPTNATIEIVLKPESNLTQGVATFDRSDATVSGSNYDARRILLYNDNTVGFVGKSGNTYSNPLSNHYAERKLVAEYTDFTVDKALINGQEVTTGSQTHSYTFSGSPQIRIGAQTFGNTGQAPYAGKIYAMRVYNRKLTAEELSKNLSYDNTRFNLGLTL